MSNLTKKSKFDTLVLGTLRAILDSRYQDLMYNSMHHEINSDFTEYCFWWLGMYRVDKTSRKVVLDDLIGTNKEDNQRLW